MAKVFDSSVPMPKKRYEFMSADAVEYYFALRKSRALRSAIECAMSEIERRGSHVVTNGVRGADSWTWGSWEDGSEKPWVASDYKGGKIWSMDQDRKMNARVFEALVAWKKTYDVFTDDEKIKGKVYKSAEFRPQGVWPSDHEFLQILKITFAESQKSARRTLENGVWWNWFGMNESAVDHMLYRAEQDGSLVFDRAGSVVDLRFPDPGMEFTGARGSRQQPVRPR